MPTTPNNRKTFYTVKNTVEKDISIIKKDVSSLASSVTVIQSGGNNHKITDYISSFELDLYIYSGFIKNNNTHIIKRVKDSIEEFAQGVTDLTTDWANRLILTYI